MLHTCRHGPADSRGRAGPPGICPTPWRARRANQPCAAASNADGAACLNLSTTSGLWQPPSPAACLRLSAIGTAGLRHPQYAVRPRCLRSSRPGSANALPGYAQCPAGGAGGAIRPSTELVWCAVPRPSCSWNVESPVPQPRSTAGVDHGVLLPAHCDGTWLLWS